MKFVGIGSDRFWRSTPALVWRMWRYSRKTLVAQLISRTEVELGTSRIASRSAEQYIII